MLYRILMLPGMANNLTLVQQKLSDRLRACAVSQNFDPEQYEARKKAFKGTHLAQKRHIIVICMQDSSRMKAPPISFPVRRC